MKYTVVLVFGIILSLALAEPLRYRSPQNVRASAKQTDRGVAFQAELGETTTESSDESDEETRTAQPTEQPTQQPAEQPAEVPFTTTSIQYWPSRPSPYYPKGWRPAGQLLVVPFAVRENVESTTNVESNRFNDAETTEATPTTQATNDELETSEPKTKKTAAYKKTNNPLKFSGELKVETKDASPQSNEQTNDESETTTENLNETTTTATEPKSGDLETTSEPESEAVEAKTSNDDGQQSTNTNQAPAPQQSFFIQLPDGSLQRIVYLAPPANQAAFTQQPANVQTQQLNQSPNYSFGFNPIANPRIVTFSTQYHAF